MAESQEINDIRIEVQKLLGLINDDVAKLKNELNSVNNLIEENASAQSLPLAVKMVNEKLMIVAKDAGINLEDLGAIEGTNDLEEGAQENTDAEQSNDNAPASNVAALFDATDKLTEKMKSVFKK